MPWNPGHLSFKTGLTKWLNALPDRRIIAMCNSQVDRISTIDALASLREEWQVAIEESSLLDVTCPAALLLFDICTRLGLDPYEQAVVLGEDLQAEILAKVQ
jgi:hypothetical protein